MKDPRLPSTTMFVSSNRLKKGFGNVNGKNIQIKKWPWCACLQKRLPKKAHLSAISTSNENHARGIFFLLNFFSLKSKVKIRPPPKFMFQERIFLKILSMQWWNTSQTNLERNFTLNSKAKKDWTMVVYRGSSASIKSLCLFSSSSSSSEYIKKIKGVVFPAVPRNVQSLLLPVRVFCPW